MDNQLTITEVSTVYDVRLPYHSAAKCENFDATIKIAEYDDGTITAEPYNGKWHAFVFEHSDPDRMIAVAQMLLASAQMVKNHNRKTIDTSTNE